MGRMMQGMTASDSPNIVEATGLTKSFRAGKGHVQALAGLDLVAAAGEVTAVLGPNGAGKSTLVRAVATLVRPDGGQLRVAGIDAARHPDRVRRLIGLAGQHAAVEPALTGRENLVMVARLFGHRPASAAAAAAAVLAQLSLEDAADAPCPRQPARPRPPGQPNRRRRPSSALPTVAPVWPSARPPSPVARCGSSGAPLS